MTVWELIGMLSKCKPTDKVVIPVELGHATVGASPSREVTTVERGFDWNDKKVMLGIEEGKLTVLTHDEYRDLIKYKQLVSSARGHSEIGLLNDHYVRRSQITKVLLDNLEPDSEALCAILLKMGELKLV